MRRPLSLFLGSTALAAVLSLTAAAQEGAPRDVGEQGRQPPVEGQQGADAPRSPRETPKATGAPTQEYSGGGSGVHDAHLLQEPGVAVGPQYSDGGCCHHDTCPAIISPVEAYGVHPFGDNCCRKGTITPYYAPLAPTATCYRYRIIRYTPYYCGYCRPHHQHSPPYGSDGGWGPGPVPDHAPDALPLTYGPYTSVLRDDTTFWNMGGNGLVPYGTPRPPHPGPPDIVDMIQASRGGPGHCAPDGAPVAVLSAGTAPAILPPTEKPEPAH
jgi:hypothetical protein